MDDAILLALNGSVFGEAASRLGSYPVIAFPKCRESELLAVAEASAIYSKGLPVELVAVSDPEEASSAIAAARPYPLVIAYWGCGEGEIAELIGLLPGRAEGRGMMIGPLELSSNEIRSAMAGKEFRAWSKGALWVATFDYDEGILIVSSGKVGPGRTLTLEPRFAIPLSLGHARMLNEAVLGRRLSFS